MDHHAHPEKRSGISRWVFWGFVAVAGFFLFTEHRAHVFGVLPYLLLLACPLMHLFHGHGGHHHPEPDGKPEDPAANEQDPDKPNS